MSEPTPEQLLAQMRRDIEAARQAFRARARAVLFEAYQQADAISSAIGDVSPAEAFEAWSRDLHARLDADLERDPLTPLAPDLSAPLTPTGESQLERLRVLALEATNGWACYARRKIELDDIARLHKAIRDVTDSGPLTPFDGRRPPLSPPERTHDDS